MIKDFNDIKARLTENVEKAAECVKLLKSIERITKKNGGSYADIKQNFKSDLASLRFVNDCLFVTSKELETVVFFPRKIRQLTADDVSNATNAEIQAWQRIEEKRRDRITAAETAYNNILLKYNELCDTITANTEESELLQTLVCDLLAHKIRFNNKL